MASDVAVEHRLSAWNPNAEEIAAILLEMRPIVRAFAERDAGTATDCAAVVAVVRDGTSVTHLAANFGVSR